MVIAMPKGLYLTGIWLPTTVFVDVSITKTLLLPVFVTYTTGAAPAIFTIIKNKAVENKAKEYDFCLLIIYSPSH